MVLLIHGLLVALALGAVVAPVLAGLLGVAGLASNPTVREWLFIIPETICGVAGYDQPGLGGLIAGWVVEFTPLGIVIAALMRVRAKRSATDRAAAFEQAVSVFHSQHDEDEHSEYGEDDTSGPAPMRRMPERDAA
jgi:hypothetical protein